jgi:hypothetical protein
MKLAKKECVVMLLAGGQGFEYETVNKTLRKLLNADNDFY